MSARNWRPGAGGDWQTVYLDSREDLPAFGVIEIVPQRIRRGAASGATALSGRRIFEGETQTGRHEPPLIAISGDRALKRRRHGRCTTGRVAVAAVNATDFSAGDFMFACADRPRLEPFRTFDDDDGNTIHTIDYRIAGVFRVLSEVERDESLYESTGLALVYRVPDFRWLVQAFEDVASEAAGVFEVRTSIAAPDGKSDWPALAGSEDVTNFRVRAFNRWGALSAGDWAVLQIVDGVLTPTGGMAGGSCSCGNVWYLAGHGGIAAGSEVTFDFTVNGTTVPITMSFGMSAAALQALLRAHPEVNAGTSSVVCDLGPWPAQEIHVTFSGVLSELSAPFSGINNAAVVPYDGGGGLRIGAFQPATEV